MWIFIGQVLIILGLGSLIFGVGTELSKKLEVDKGKRIETLDYNYIGADGKIQKTISYLILVDEKEKDKFDINTSGPFEIKERK